MSDKVARIGFIVCLLSLWALLPESCTRSETTTAAVRPDPAAAATATCPASPDCSTPNAATTMSADR